MSKQIKFTPIQKFYFESKKFLVSLAFCMAQSKINVHTGKYSDRSFEVRTERSEVPTKT